MVNFVDVLVKWAPVKGSVRPVMPSILEYEEDGNLVRNLVPGGEGHTCTEAKVQRHGMEEPEYVRRAAKHVKRETIACNLDGEPYHI